MIGVTFEAILAIKITAFSIFVTAVYAHDFMIMQDNNTEEVRTKLFI